MPHIVTSAQAEDHINSFNMRHYNASTYGPGQYVLPCGRQLAATMVDSNTLRILDGAGLVNGAFWEVEGSFEEVIIENGTPGCNRTDLVVAHIETAPQETITLRVLKGEESTGEPVMPAYIEGDLNDGDTVVEQPLHAVTLDGINPGEPVAQFEVSPSLMEFRDSMSRKLIVAETGRVKATLPAAARGTVDIPVNAPDGYVLAGVLGLGSTATGDAAPVVWWLDDDGISTDWRNLTSKNITAEFMAQVLYIPA